MNRITRVAALLLVVAFSAAGITYAQGAPPPTNGGTGSSPPGASGPTIWITGRSADQQPGLLSYPFDFNFTYQIYGQGFQPGEHVTVSVANASTAAVSETADASGTFSAQMSFSWVFCGAGASRQPAPVFTATGDKGSRAQAADQATPCPELLAQVLPPPGMTSGSGSGNIQPGATAIAEPATPMTASAGATPPQSSPPQASPPITSVPQDVTISAEGFGFAAGEVVTISAAHFDPAPTPPSMQVTADTMGRIRFTLQATLYLPNPCSRPFNGPVLLASGNKGTSVEASIGWLARPMMGIPCAAPPIGGPVGGTTQPGTGGNSPTTGGTPIPLPTPGGNPGNGSNPPPGPATGVTPAPAPAPAPATQPNAPVQQLSVSVRPGTVRPGGTVRATVASAAAGTVGLAIQYPKHGSAHMHRSIAAGASVTIQWHVPRNAHTGRARVTVTLGTGNTSISTFFRIR